MNDQWICKDSHAVDQTYPDMYLTGKLLKILNTDQGHSKGTS